MDKRALENVLQFKQVDDNTYETIQHPLWTWTGTQTVPGPTLMALAAAAAYKTVGSDFSIKTLQAHFLAGPEPDTPLVHNIQRLNDSGRFAHRVVSVEQKGKIVLHVTCSFVRASAMGGRSMTHCAKRVTKDTIDAITLDDLEPGRDERGPPFQFQRLSVVHNGPDSAPQNAPPETFTYTSAATISPPIKTSSPHLHALGIIALSDYHVMDCVPTTHNVTFGLPAINDSTRTPTKHDFKTYTSLNHSIHFHVHEGFRADELCYIEVNTPWARDRRAEVQSRIFDKSGVLIASCVQESYFVFKEGSDSKL